MSERNPILRRLREVEKKVESNRDDDLEGTPVLREEPAEAIPYNRCRRCKSLISPPGTDESQVTSQAEWDNATGAGPYCSTGCIELDRRGL